MYKARDPSRLKQLLRALSLCLAAAALLSAAPALHAAADGATLGYSPGNMDKWVNSRTDFYRYVAGHWLERAQMRAGERVMSGFTELSINLDKQLLKLITDSAKAATGSTRQQIDALGSASAQG